jgi:farnesol dehydrogenase
MMETSNFAPVDRVFLTGGTGYLGKHLVREFLAAGYELLLLTREDSDRSGLPLDGIRYVEGDLLDPSSYRQVLGEVGAVVHTAGLVSRWEKDKSLFDRVNVDALDGLLHACEEAHVARVIYTSSFFVLGPGEDATPRNETQRMPVAGFNDYDRTKILAERCVKEHRKRGLDIVSLLPTVIYGPGARTQGNHVAEILEDLLRQKLPGLIGSGDQVWNYVYVNDAARGHRLALEKGEACADYLLGGENASMAQFLELAAELGEVAAPTRHVPFALLMAVARLQMLRAKLTGKAPELTSGMVRSYQYDWAFDDAKARRELGYQGRPLREGLRETVGWLRRGGDSPFRDERWEFE